MAGKDSNLSKGAPVKDAPQPSHKRLAEGQKYDGQSNPNGGEAEKGRSIGNCSVNY